MPAIVRQALLARSTIDISSSSSSSIASPAVDISDDSVKRTIALDKDRLEQLEKEQAKSSLSDLTLKEAAEVMMMMMINIMMITNIMMMTTRWLSGVTLLCSTSSRETTTGSPVCRWKDILRYL